MLENICIRILILDISDIIILSIIYKSKYVHLSYVLSDVRAGR